MKNSDLKNIKEHYTTFRSLLFNNDIPTADNIDFILHSLKYAVGYSSYKETPGKSGNHHVIAFSKYFAYDERLVMETLIHEMIHLWQVYHVKEERYKVCSHYIAHDRVFSAKMNTINLILQKNFYDYKISEVCNEDLLLDSDLDSKTPFYVLFLINSKYDGRSVMIKVKEKDIEKVKSDYINLCKEHNIFKKIGLLKTNSFMFNLLGWTKGIVCSFNPTIVNGRDTRKVFEDEIEIIYDSANI